ncbi:hypothetical protein C9422_26785 [Pseudomonas sp. B1(2018)]|nr:hypothetical protein C9422_26785 [Pseudomonas sp. B1(2018)]
MARELAPAGRRSRPRKGAAARPSGSKLPRHICFSVVIGPADSNLRIIDLCSSPWTASMASLPTTKTKDPP